MKKMLAYLLVFLGLLFSASGNAAHALKGGASLLPGQFPGNLPPSEPPANDSTPMEVPALSKTGWFFIVWGDSLDGATRTSYYLTEDNGQTDVLLINEEQIQLQGGILSFNQRYVTVQGAVSDPTTEQGRLTTVNVSSIALASPPDQHMSAVSGPQPWISIMCKFNDVAAEPKNQLYFQEMYGSSWPGLDYYWREVSFETVNVLGSTAVGWYTLPQPRSYYVYNNALDFYRAANDCTSVADPYVNFSGFAGINLMFNDELDGYAWGGGHYMTLDGVTKVWSTTWEPPWGYSSVTVISHEMGHGLGLPHSSGMYGATYDNRWDVMSDIWSDCGNSTDFTYGCLGQHTIAYHKDILGWIPAAQKYIAGEGAVTITLEQLALPQTSNYKMAQIPINGSSNHFYTVEVRRKVGYDVKLPGQAVIIHEVDTNRQNQANVIDADGNGNTGDNGAMWQPGETFTDATNGISVSVLSATSTGFEVSITTPIVTATTFRSTATNDGWILESSEASGVGGTMNSSATLIYFGDNAQNKQYRSILSFNTSSLPDNAVITKVTLKLKQQGITGGGNPVSMFQGFVMDIKNGVFGAAPLALGDFKATASKTVGPKSPALVSGWYNLNLINGKGFINKLGLTQIRLRFKLDDNNNAVANFLKIYSGNAGAANRPQLVIEYYVP